MNPLRRTASMFSLMLMWIGSGLATVNTIMTLFHMSVSAM